jgi:hypothetical protein
MACCRSNYYLFLLPLPGKTGRGFSKTCKENSEAGLVKRVSKRKLVLIMVLMIIHEAVK